MPVPGGQRQVVLACERGDPQIVVGDGFANLSEFRLQLSFSPRKYATTRFVSTRTLPVAFIDCFAAFLDHPIQFVGVLWG